MKKVLLFAVIMVTSIIAGLLVVSFINFPKIIINKIGIDMTGDIYRFISTVIFNSTITGSLISLLIFIVLIIKVFNKYIFNLLSEYIIAYPLNEEREPFALVLNEFLVDLGGNLDDTSRYVMHGAKSITTNKKFLIGYGEKGEEFIYEYRKVKKFSDIEIIFKTIKSLYK